jgi:hypothetical protein
MRSRNVILIALERMADLTLTALDLAELPQNPAPAPRQEPAEAAETESGFLPEDGAELSTASGATIASSIINPHQTVIEVVNRTGRRELQRFPFRRMSPTKGSLNWRQFHRLRSVVRRPPLFPRLCFGCRNALLADFRFPRAELSASIVRRRTQRRHLTDENFGCRIHHPNPRPHHRWRHRHRHYRRSRRGMNLCRPFS